MPLEVVVCAESDLAHCVKIEDKAFNHDSKGESVLFPGPFPANHTEIQADAKVKAMKENPSIVWLKVVDTDAADPVQGIAYAKWYVFKDQPATTRPPVFMSEGANREACNWFFGHMEAKFPDYIGNKNCVFLAILVTDPDHWRRGAGGMLVKWGIDLANQYGIPAYVEATEKGSTVYRRGGFVEKEHVTVDMSKFGAKEPYTFRIMLYEPAVSQ